MSLPNLWELIHRSVVVVVVKHLFRSHPVNRGHSYRIARDIKKKLYTKSRTSFLSPFEVAAEDEVGLYRYILKMMRSAMQSDTLDLIPTHIGLSQEHVGSPVPIITKMVNM